MSKHREQTEASESQSNAESTVDAASADDAEHLREEVARANDRALRAAAELENFRRRSRKQLDDERRYAAVPLIQSLLPVLDNISRAISSAEGSANSAGGGNGLLDGFKIVASQLQSVLEKFHCEPIAALGEPFDPNWHEAILQQPSDEYDAGTVMLVTEEGYKLHDRVVRPAKVIVSTGGAKS